MPAGSASPASASRTRTPSPLAPAAGQSPTTARAQGAFDGRRVALAAPAQPGRLQDAKYLPVARPVPPGALVATSDGIWVLGAPTPRALSLAQRAVAQARQPRLDASALRRDIPAQGAGQATPRTVGQMTVQGVRADTTVEVPRGVPTRVAQHLLAGDRNGGGHAFQAAPFRATRPASDVVTWFARAWSDRRILEVAQALVQDRQLPVQPENAVGRADQGGYAERFSGFALVAPNPGSQEGAVPVKFVFEVPPFRRQADSRVLVTAYPVKRWELDEFVAAQNARAVELAAIRARK